MASVDDIWLVDFGDPFPGEPAHQRPALVVGPPDAFGPGFPFVVVCPLTTARRELSLHVEIVAGPSNGLDEDSYIQCELIRSISSARLVHRVGAIDPESHHQVHDVLSILLGH